LGYAQYEFHAFWRPLLEAVKKREIHTRGPLVSQKKSIKQFSCLLGVSSVSWMRHIVCEYCPLFISVIWLFVLCVLIHCQCVDNWFGLHHESLWHSSSPLHSNTWCRYIVLRQGMTLSELLAVSSTSDSIQ